MIFQLLTDFPRPCKDESERKKEKIAVLCRRLDHNGERETKMKKSAGLFFSAAPICCANRPVCSVLCSVRSSLFLLTAARTHPAAPFLPWLGRDFIFLFSDNERGDIWILDARRIKCREIDAGNRRSIGPATRHPEMHQCIQ